MTYYLILLLAFPGRHNVFLELNGNQLSSHIMNYKKAQDFQFDFVSRGIVVLDPQTLGVDESIHARIYEKQTKLFRDKVRITCANVPDMLSVIRSPGVVSACDQLLGENWAIVPYAHATPFLSGALDQHWHKDDNGPYNQRRHRHHQAVQVEMLYYPGEVREDMGPTATIPYSHYWTFNHEENHDNFAGADHLDFGYHISGMEKIAVSGPNTSYAKEEIAARATAHDVRMRSAVENTRWPLVTSCEAAPLRAGSVVLYSHNLFHRGNHRRDDWHTWESNPRFMWRFYLYRTTHPGQARTSLGSDSSLQNELNADIKDVAEDVKSVWRHQFDWIRYGEAHRVSSQGSVLGEATRLLDQIQTTGDASEPLRIGAGYRLAALGESKIAIEYLAKALASERENVRRAALYGLIAVGDEAVETLLCAAGSSRKWVRRAAISGLGDIGVLSSEVLSAIGKCLLYDESLYVRSAAAISIGCIVRRAVSREERIELIPQAVRLLLDSLLQEKNRLGMDRAQGRSIKFVRPTDESDVCEGIGIDYGVERFKPVRSVARENALWSMVVICTHRGEVLGAMQEPLVELLTSIAQDEENVFCVGLALDALQRLSYHFPELERVVAALLETLPLRSWESLVCSGLGLEMVSEFES